MSNGYRGGACLCLLVSEVIAFYGLVEQHRTEEAGRHEQLNTYHHHEYIDFLDFLLYNDHLHT